MVNLRAQVYQFDFVQTIDTNIQLFSERAETKQLLNSKDDSYKLIIYTSENIKLFDYKSKVVHLFKLNETNGSTEFIYQNSEKMKFFDMNSVFEVSKKDENEYLVTVYKNQKKKQITSTIRVNLVESDKDLLYLKFYKSTIIFPGMMELLKENLKENQNYTFTDYTETYYIPNHPDRIIENKLIETKEINFQIDISKTKF